MTSDDARVEALFAEVCLRTESEEELTRELPKLLDAHGIAGERAAAFLAAPGRLALYRRLVRNNLTGVSEKILKRTKARLDAAAPGIFDASVSAFLRAVGPGTHYLRDVPGELVAWVEPQWRARADLPRWIVDLARHELVEFEIGAGEGTGRDDEAVEATPERPLLFAGPVRIVRYAYAIHELPAEEGDDTHPAERAVALLAYRDEEHAVEFVELTALEAAVVERLLAGAPLIEAAREGAAALGQTGGLIEIARCLADLGERGVLLGGRP